VSEIDVVPEPDAVPELTIVMPYYNPGDHLGRNVSDVVAVLEKTGLDF